MSARHPPLSSAADGSGGFIVVTVLWLLGALAALVSIYAQFTLETAVAFAAHDDRLRSDWLAAAALELTAYQILLPGPSRPSGGRFNFRLGGANISVEFRSETARIDLNAASKELLAGLFATRGGGGPQADHYAERIIAWRTSGAGARDREGALYRAAGLRYLPRADRFPHVNELPLVLGLPPDLVERVMPYITVYSGRPQINVLAAAPEVLAALPGITRAAMQAVLIQREAAVPDAPRLLALLGPAQGYAGLDAGPAYRVAAHMTFDHGATTDAEVVILMTEKESDPFSVLAWHGSE